MSRILLVNDSPTLAAMCSFVLQDSGFETVEARSVEQALQALESALVDLIVTEASLDGLSGIELCERIRGNAATASVPVVIRTGANDAACAQRAEAAGATACVPADSEPDVLLQAVQQALTASNDNNVTAPPDGPLNLLLAEDSPTTQQLAVLILSRQGHTIDLADNGAIAVEKAATGNYDAILMDVEMPEMDGLEATTRIRQQEESSGKRTPIFAITVHDNEKSRQRCLDAGMDDLLSKPVKNDELVQALARRSG